MTSPRRVRPVITGRALVLGGVVVLLVVLLASPLHRFLASRSDVSSAAQQLRDDQRELARLRHQKALWDDPGYIQQQARARLQFAMPGDTVYVVVDKGAKSDIEKTSGKTPSTGKRGKTWNERLWDSVQAASR
jgi:cell division protein FtsB